MKTIFKVLVKAKPSYVKELEFQSGELSIVLTSKIEKALDLFDHPEIDQAEAVLNKVYGENRITRLRFDAKGLRTDEGVDVSERIESGQTFVSRIRETAQGVADDKRSYVYDLFLKGKFWGYGVPN